MNYWEIATMYFCFVSRGDNSSGNHARLMQHFEVNSSLSIPLSHHLTNERASAKRAGAQVSFNQNALK